ncbi:hypothetical protein IWQ47_001940 [Aquimarina sp. EL_43]|uniref:hypothetical protein n=1 Tax=Aquimarina TaxID=290174 RepID=UPI0004725478|nr:MULTISPECIES: hypothetical protein [Aquimarina]MBG6129977.1 hypothetical protein [Aquimarina sp. EL_35]MBG6148757.1 hypothetical protein [Aquimarina sp. EL_32]MBG6168869.1 hypothetical protein [Aquimarina sp. EL_43]
MKFKISNNRKAGLFRLTQWEIYDRLVEGVPTQSYNNREIERIKTDLRKRWKKIPVHVIEPKQEIKSEWINKKGERHQELPKIVCIGWFRYEEINDLENSSTLVIVWFQNNYALPISRENLNAITNLDWDRLSIPYSH